jgi:hypothetical protein
MEGVTNKRFLYINSFNRLSGTSSAFSIQIQVPPNENYDACTVTQVFIPVSYYLIVAGSNTFNLVENGVETEVTIPAGNYNVNSFCTVIPVLLNAASPNGWVYTMTYPQSFTQNNTGHITYGVTGNGGQQPEFHFNDQMDKHNYVNQQFGFDYGAQVPFVANALVSLNVVDFTNQTTLFIHSDIVDGGDNDIIQEVYHGDSTQLSILDFVTPDVDGFSKRLRIPGSQIANFYITDQNNKTIDLNGLDCVFTILLYKRNDFYIKANAFMKYLLESQHESN